jgi:hypothetical protein
MIKTGIFTSAPAAGFPVNMQNNDIGDRASAFLGLLKP